MNLPSLQNFHNIEKDKNLQKITNKSTPKYPEEQKIK